MTTDLDADVGAASSANRPATSALVAVFAVVAALTAGELFVIGMAASRAARIGALGGLLMAKVGIVLSWVLGGRAARGAAALPLVAIVMAVGFAVVLMLEIVYRVNVP
jgi:hypothetical protein